MQTLRYIQQRGGNDDAKETHGIAQQPFYCLADGHGFARQHDPGVQLVYAGLAGGGFGLPIYLACFVARDGAAVAQRDGALAFWAGVDGNQHGGGAAGHWGQF